MFWSSYNNEVKKQKSIMVHFEPGELDDRVVSDYDNYPFTVSLQQGHGSLNAHMSYGELECLVAQGLQVLQEADRKRIEREL